MVEDLASFWFANWSRPFFVKTEAKSVIKCIDKMLSFFTKKKHNPEVTPDKIIQGPVSEEEPVSSDFIIVERKDSAGGTKGGTAFYPPLPYPSAQPVASETTISPTPTSLTPVPFLQDVPFTLSSCLLAQKEAEDTQIQVDEILALFTRQMALYDREDKYTFQLERSIKDE